MVVRNLSHKLGRIYHGSTIFICFCCLAVMAARLAVINLLVGTQFDEHSHFHKYSDNIFVPYIHISFLNNTPGESNAVLLLDGGDRPPRQGALPE